MNFLLIPFINRLFLIQWKCCLLNWRELRKLLCFASTYIVIQACVMWALYALISNLSGNDSSPPGRSWQFWLKVSDDF